MKTGLGLIGFVVCLSFKCAGADAGNDIGDAVKSMQAQMAAMALKMEAQQKKIDEQDRTIAALKGQEVPIHENTAISKLTSPDIQSKPRGDGLYELPGVTVTGEPIRQAPANINPDSVGTYGQPKWTAQRRFTETRAYVIPEGDFEFEYWNTQEVQRGKLPTISEQKYEAEIGLGNRLQLDIYALSHSAGNGKAFGFDEHDVELRYAFADWDKIPGNPTAYGEYKFLNNEPDHLEFKMLFCGEAKPCLPKLQWAANAVWEHQMGAKQESTYEITGGLSYEWSKTLSFGGETKCAYTDEHGSRLDFKAPELLLGPSIQYCPLKNLHIDFSPLIGLTHNSPELKSLLIVGWKF